MKQNMSNYSHSKQYASGGKWSKPVVVPQYASGKRSPLWYLVDGTVITGILWGIYEAVKFLLASGM